MVLITITQKNVDTGAAKSGKLYLVDLAGSEKVHTKGEKEHKVAHVSNSSHACLCIVH